MKRALLVLLLVLAMATMAMASVTATILDVSQDTGNGSIIVKTQYVLDGVEVQSRYPLFDGKYYWVTRYNVSQFAGMTDQQVKTFILKDLQSFGEQLIRKTYFEKANFQYTQSKANALIGTTGTISTAEVDVDTNADGVVDTTWVVKTDGTRTENAISTENTVITDTK